MQGKKAYGRPRTMLLDWLLTEDGGRQYWLRRAKDVCPGQVMIESMNEDVKL